MKRIIAGIAIALGLLGAAAGTSAAASVTASHVPATSQTFYHG
jgi:hypothetical protein